MSTHALLYSTCSAGSFALNSAAAALIEARSARSSFRKTASFPVSRLSSAMAAAALSALYDAMYTFALRARRTYIHIAAGIQHGIPLQRIRTRARGVLTRAVSFPMPASMSARVSHYILPLTHDASSPALPPVTMITFPVRSGTWSGWNLLFGG